MIDQWWVRLLLEGSEPNTADFAHVLEDGVRGRVFSTLTPLSLEDCLV